MSTVIHTQLQYGQQTERQAKHDLPQQRMHRNAHDFTASVCETWKPTKTNNATCKGKDALHCKDLSSYKET